MFYAILLTLVLVVGLTFSAPTPAGYAIHDKRTASPHHWKKRSRASSGATLPVHLSMKQRNLHLGGQYLDDISNPGSPNYGKHWTRQKISEVFSPTAEHLLSPGRGWIKFEATVEEMEELLRTEYHDYEHAETNGISIGCDEYSLPHELRPHINFITPTVDFSTRAVRKWTATRSPPKPSRSKGTIERRTSTTSADLSTCSTDVTHDYIRALYNIPLNNATNQTGNELGIFEEGESYDQADLDLFFPNVATNIPIGTHPTLLLVDGAIGPINKTNSNFETMLDIDVSFPLIYPQGIKLFVTGGNVDSYLEAVDASYCIYDEWSCGVLKPTSVLSISYDSNEASNPAHTISSCNEFMKLALQGVSVLVSSGDGGVAGGGSSSCGSNGSFAALYPQDCPYVTSVGATMIPKGGSVTDPEEAASITYAISNFLTNHPPAYSSMMYNASGKGFPDVSANGAYISKYNNGSHSRLSGTSASAPLFASIITLINENRLAAGKTPVGFLNPTLYANPGAFNDIVTGNNPGCGTNGFNATTGWDPLSGLGTPDFEKLLEVFMALP